MHKYCDPEGNAIDYLAWKKAQASGAFNEMLGRDYIDRKDVFVFTEWHGVYPAVYVTYVGTSEVILKRYESPTPAEAIQTHERVVKRLKPKARHRLALAAA
jgi:hypothetical protein